MHASKLEVAGRMGLTVLRGGTLVDGTGADARRGDVLIEGECIAAAGIFEPPPDARVIDCAGLTVAPGFIDAHSHSDLQVFARRPEKVRQGITSEVVGNCGISAFPAGPDRRALHEFANLELCGSGDWGWAGARAYLDAAAIAEPDLTTGTLIGHGTLRIACGGDPGEMEAALEQALSEGALGLSAGLTRLWTPPPPEELLPLCRVAARHGKIYCAHLSSYKAGLVQALAEQIDLARRSGVKLQISHFQALGPANWPKQARALELIEKAHEEGIDVAFDCHPYTAHTTPLPQLLPQWALEGGIESLLRLLSNPAERKRIAAETAADRAHRWTDVVIAGVPSRLNRDLIGRTVAGVAAEQGSEPVEVILELLLAERGNVVCLVFDQSEGNLRHTLAHPLSIVATGGVYVNGLAHPALFGAFPRLLGEMVRRRRWLTLPQAIRKITGWPAERFGLAKRGRIERGFEADLTVFKAGEIHSAADYENPAVYSAGIRYVFHRGKAVVGLLQS